MQQDNTIETKLRRLENQQLPDLSSMDAHWQQMQGTLQPAVPATKRRPWGSLLAVAVILLVMLLMWRYQPWQQNTANTKQPIAASAVTPALPAADTTPAAVLVQSGDTLKLIYKNVTAIGKITVRNPRYFDVGNGNYATPGTTKVDTQYFNLSFVDCKDTINNMANRQAQLENLYADLEKQPESYIIDNRADTLLQCKEGTILFIPAGSLSGSSEVELKVKEFFIKSDIVLNQLSATSNKEMLETGGMLHLSATVNGSPVDVFPGKPVQVFLPGSDSAMKGMQLFTGEKVTDKLPINIVKFDDQLRDITNGPASTYINWQPKGRYFNLPPAPQNEVRVVDLSNTPAKTIERRRGTKAIFFQDNNSAMSRKQLKEYMQEKYGYYKVKIKRTRRDGRSWLLGRPQYNPARYGGLGDTTWMDEATARVYGLPVLERRQLQSNNAGWNGIGEPDNNYTAITFNQRSNKQAASIAQKMYSVSIQQLGWINCDRFYEFKKDRIEYVVNIGDTAMGYFTLLVFDDIQSVMNGYTYGQKAVFKGVPVDMKVTIVSIGINSKGQAVYARRKAVTANAEYGGLAFVPVLNTEQLKSELKKLDQ